MEQNRSPKYEQYLTLPNTNPIKDLFDFGLILA
jgi:hypothetical protein